MEALDNKLKIDLIEQGIKTEVTLSGIINEDVDFSILHNLSGEVLTIDLNGITHINSCGIRDWIELQNNHFHFKKIIYKRCPQVIIEQMNIVAGFIHPNGEIESFYAPYYSNDLDKEYKVLITPKDVVNTKAPSKKDEKGNNLEFDDIEEQYFSFLKRLERS